MQRPSPTFVFASTFVALSSLSLAQIEYRRSEPFLGGQGNDASERPSLGLIGWQICFESLADDLVAGDTNDKRDIFVKERSSGLIWRVSVATNGTQSNGHSRSPQIALLSRYVVFESDASNLVAGDTNGSTDVFRHDRNTGETVLVSFGPAGQGNNYSIQPTISADGARVAFASKASNLVAGDTNARIDVFVRDLVAATTTRVSLTAGGLEANSDSYEPFVSGDGQWVAFESLASNLVAGDTNNASDVFYTHLPTLAVAAASRTTGGTWGNGASRNPAMSNMGNLIAFETLATNLSTIDTNGVSDVLVYNRFNGSFTRCSVDAMGVQANGASFDAAISSAGSHVAFASDGTNLAAGDTNGRTDVFLRALSAGAGPVIASKSNLGGFCDGNAMQPALGNDGSYVVFDSDATDVISGDTNARRDVFEFVVAAPAPQVYCTAGVTTHGCVPQIAFSGSASLGASSGATVSCTQIEGQRSGLMFYGLASQAAPWGTGSSFLCIAPPTQRTNVQNTGGNAGQCDGALAEDFNAWVNAHPLTLGAPFEAGQSVFAQVWFRDPGASKNTNLSAAVRFTVVQ